jgi:ribosomal protein S27E
MEHLLICSCGEVLVKSTSDGTKLRSKIIIFKAKGAVAICKGCGKELPIPISLNQEELLSKSRNPKLFITK